MATVNAGFGSVSPVADGGVAHVLDTAVAYTSGKLASFKNNAVEKAYVDYAGNINGVNGVFTGTLAITGASTLTGAVSVDDTTDSTSGTTGSIHTDGGLGVAKALYVGTSMTVAGAGPHAIGGAAANFAQLNMSGSFVSGGASTVATAARFVTDLTGASGDTTYLTNLAVGGTITTQGVSDTIGIVATLILLDPNITVGAGDTVSEASTLYVDAAPTEGASNYAVHVNSGDTRLDGGVMVGVTSIFAGGPKLYVSKSTASEETFRVDGIGGAGQLICTNGVAASSSHVTITAALRLTAGYAAYIGDTANANMTTGLTINGGTADDQHFCLKNADVATGVLGLTPIATETDDFLVLGKADATTGGCVMQVMAEDAAPPSGYVFTVQAIGGQADTGKTTAALGILDLYASEHNGANAKADITADGNVLTVRARVGGADVARLLVDEDGDLYSVTAAQTFDEHDDLALLNKYDIVRRDSLREQYAQWASEYEDELVSLGILGAPVADGGMTNLTQLTRLLVGAMRQVGDRLAATETRLAAAELKLLESPNG